MDPRNTYPRSIDPRNRDQHDARDRSRDHRSNERPTHEDDRGDNSDAQRNSYHSGMSNSMSRPVLEPQSPNIRWDCVSAISPMDNPIRGHHAPPMLDIRRTGSTLGSVFDGSSSESADRHDHGPT